MEIILWRHADAESGVPDHDRELTAAGRKQAKKVAKWLAKRLPQGTRVLVSPALRAVQTARCLTKDYRISRKLGPGASPADVLAAAGWPKEDGCVVVVGHQPTLGGAAALLLAGRETGWSIRKGGAWWLASRARGEVVVRAVMSPEIA
ncbi:MAG: histidine phosphatase family protein [Betaproteobacteria bacterium]|nr:histidine phosphatase family protein [Betaproteobacteria bacterium]